MIFSPSLWEGFLPAPWSLAAAKKCDPRVTFRLELSKTWWETCSMTTVAWQSTIGGRREGGGFTEDPNWKWIWLSSSSCQEAKNCAINSPALGAWRRVGVTWLWQLGTFGVTLRIGMKRRKVGRSSSVALHRALPRQPLIALLCLDFSEEADFRFCSVASEGISQINLR